MIIAPQISSFADFLDFCAPPLTAPSGQDEWVYDQTVLSAAHPHPARPRNPQTAIVDSQDGSLPSAGLASQMPKGKWSSCDSVHKEHILSEVSVRVMSSAAGEMDIAQNIYLSSRHIALLLHQTIGSVER